MGLSPKSLKPKTLQGCKLCSYLEKNVVDPHKLLWFGYPPTSFLWLFHGLDEQQAPVDGMLKFVVREVVQEGLQILSLCLSLLGTLLITSGL